MKSLLFFAGKQTELAAGDKIMFDFENQTVQFMRNGLSIYFRDSHGDTHEDNKHSWFSGIAGAKDMLPMLLVLTGLKPHLERETATELVLQLV